MRRKTTKELLAESFLELADKKPIDKITITQITDNCGMSQPTFYNHFRDKYDLIVWTYVTRCAEIMGQIGVDGYEWKDTLLDGAKYFIGNREFVLNALKHTSGQDSFIMHAAAGNVEALTAEVRKALMTENLPKKLQGIIKIYCYGTTQYVLDCLVSEKTPTPEEVAEVWLDSLPEPLKPYLLKD